MYSTKWKMPLSYASKCAGGSNQLAEPQDDFDNPMSESSLTLQLVNCLIMKMMFQTYMIVIMTHLMVMNWSLLKIDTLHLDLVQGLWYHHSSAAPCGLRLARLARLGHRIIDDQS